MQHVALPLGTYRSSDDGRRIFLDGDDGSLWEFDYSLNRWIRRKRQKPTAD